MHSNDRWASEILSLQALTLSPSPITFCYVSMGFIGCRFFAAFVGSLDNCFITNWQLDVSEGTLNRTLLRATTQILLHFFSFNATMRLLWMIQWRFKSLFIAMILMCTWIHFEMNVLPCLRSFIFIAAVFYCFKDFKKF